MPNRRTQAWFALAVLAGVVLLFSLGWVWIGGARSEGAGAAPSPGVSAASRPERSHSLPAGDALPEISERRDAPAPGAVQAPVQEAAAGDLSLELRFVDPLRSPLQLTSAQLRLAWSDGARELAVENADSVLVEGLPAEWLTLEVVAPPFAHRTQSFDLSAGRADGNRDAGGADFEERVLLWPADWVAVVVGARDGRPLEVIAAESGMEPRRLFVNAFDVTFEVLHDRAAAIEVLDGLGLVAATPALSGKRALACELLSGDYRALLLDKERNLLGEIPFSVHGASVHLRLP